MKSATIILITLSLVSASPVKNKNKAYCTNAESLTPNSSTKEVWIHNLTNGGPRDAECPENLYRWVYYGYGHEPKCSCMDVPFSEDISPEDGEQCADWTLYPSSHSLTQGSEMNHLASRDIAPENGWCPEDEFKFIVKKEYVVGADADACFCIKDFKMSLP